MEGSEGKEDSETGCADVRGGGGSLQCIKSWELLGWGSEERWGMTSCWNYRTSLADFRWGCLLSMYTITFLKSIDSVKVVG